jgi:hypothetical protein
MFPQIPDWNAFKNQVKAICDLIFFACNVLEINKLNLISVDEKPGIQALYKKQSEIQVGRESRREVEYKRNGKICLIAGYAVGTGKIISHYFTTKNDEAAFLEFIKQTISKFSPTDQIIFLLDNLRTHCTVSLTKYIALHIGFTASLGKNRKSGILENMQTRRDFLTDPEHRIRFCYTPKHCSWLNPIENWFSILQRRVISPGNFMSVEDLKCKITDYIKYHNLQLFKQIKWTFTGFYKDKPLAA